MILTVDVSSRGGGTTVIVSIWHLPAAVQVEVTLALTLAMTGGRVLRQVGSGQLGGGVALGVEIDY